MTHQVSSSRSRKQEKPELLAPAGRMEAFCAALDAGADAVYAGTRDFNARMRAPNFTTDELIRMAGYAHRHGKRLYLTVNTIIKDGELDRLEALLRELQQIHPDALIVQDIGTARLAQAVCPEIPIHASTQMTIHNVDGALAARQMGFSRVILARECTIEEIREIRRSCEIELETFVHGAMCYSMSGQCFASGLIHGKSANRGRCLQPCRRLFSGIPETPSEHTDASPATTPPADQPRNFPAYSMRDLCAAPILERLIASGINCFKIEGRMKPPEQIAQIVRAYRLLIDAWPGLTAEVMEEARFLLDTAVGREPHTGYYLSSAPPVLGARETQSGRRAGRSEPSDFPGFFRITPRVHLKVGDRVRIQRSPTQPPQGFTIREIRYKGKSVKRPPVGATIDVAAPFPVPPGCWIVKASDADAVSRGFSRRIQEMIDAIMEIAVPPVSGQDNSNASDSIPRAARTPVLVRLDVPQPGIPPTRWIVLPTVEAAIDMAETPVFMDAPGNRETRLVVPLNAVHDKNFMRLVRVTGHGERLGLVLPQFYFGLEARESFLGALKKGLATGARNLILSNVGHLQVIRSLGRRKITLIAGSGFHLMNRAAIADVTGAGVQIAQVSLECDRDTWNRLVNTLPVGVLAIAVWGHPPAFQSRAPGPVPRDHRIHLNEPSITLKVFRRDGITYSVSASPVALPPRLIPGAERAHWIYDFTWSDLEAQAILEEVRVTETFSSSGPDPITWKKHPLFGVLE